MHQFDKRIFLEQFREIYEGGVAGGPSWVVSNGPESGVFGSIEDLTAEQASSLACGSLSVAAHVYHLSWSLSYAMAYFRGERPSPGWDSSWEVQLVDRDGWNEVRGTLRRRFEELLEAVSRRDDWSDRYMVSGTLALVSHGAYHLGVIRHLRKQVLAAGGTR